MIQPGLGSEAREGIRGGDGGVGDGTGRLGGHSGGAADRRHHAWSIVESPWPIFEKANGVVIKSSRSFISLSDCVQSVICSSPPAARS